jgi:hypothetical protein
MIGLYPEGDNAYIPGHSTRYAALLGKPGQRRAGRPRGARAAHKEDLWLRH